MPESVRVSLGRTDARGCVYAHPLSALQQFTLADLEAACGNTAGARTAMALCIRELGVTHAAEGGALLKRAQARRAEL